MFHQDRLTGETVEQLCRTAPFEGARAVEVVPLHQRNLCARVRFADGRQAFVKRALPGGANTLAHEGAVLTALAGHGLPVPSLLATLPGTDGPVLVTEDVAAAGTLDSARQAAGGTSPAWAAAIGRSLAQVHALPPADDLPASNPAARLARGWTVVTPREVTQYAGGFAEALRQLRVDGLVGLLRETASEWTPTALFHGDIKSDNILCTENPDDERPVRLIDWEGGGRGDPRWDVGSLIGDSLFTWLSGIDLDAGPTLDDWIAAADPPFSAVQEDIAAATRAYESRRPVRPADRRQWIRYAAFFLLQRLCSSAVHSPVLPIRSLAYLQVAGQLLRRPDECGELLLCP
jgi:aminoglycoside phosphotransferase (APT) family kinase protein